MKNVIIWIFALFLTLACAYYQRATGPTHPVKGEGEINGAKVTYRLKRSHGGPGDQPVGLRVPDAEVTGEILWRRYPMGRDLELLEMERDGERLRGNLPHQPPAGKIEYHIILRKGRLELRIPEEPETVITRFKGAVPSWLLIPHIILMFAAMVLSNRTGMEALRKEQSRTRRYAVVTAALLFVGGFFFGGFVQYYAFGEFWTGFPFGTDLTDNKTLIGLIGWIGALIASKGGREARGWFLFAALLLLAIYLVPHSLFGSELRQ